VVGQQNHSLTAKDAKDAKENQGVPASSFAEDTRGVQYKAKVFLCVLGVLGGESVSSF
jgi:hypothetical protein